MRTWGGRFTGDTDARVADFTRSIEIDAALAADDIAGSIAHVRGLGRAGLLDRRARSTTLVDGLAALADDVAAGPPRLGPDPRRRPHERRGGARRADRAGGRPAPHGPLAQRPGRHGPAALDAPGDRRPRCRARRASSARSSASPSATGRPSCPGTTHIQPAQPVLFAHHLLAYVEMAERDRGRLADARARLNVSPLGAGRAGRRRLPARSRGDGRGARLRRRHRELARRRLGPRLRGRDASRRSRSGWSTSAGWPRRSRGGRTRGSGSCGPPMRSRPAAR